MAHVDREIVQQARNQHGVITGQQVRSLGGTPDLTRARVRSGAWSRVARDVYLVGGAPPSYQQRAQVALLRAGPGAVASHRTAQRLWDMGAKRFDLVELTVPHGRFHRRDRVIVHTSRDLDRARVTRRHGLAVTGAARTLLDLGSVAPGVVRRGVWAGLRNDVVSWPTLLDVVVDHSRKGRAGVGPLRAVVAEHYGELGTDSGTEDVAFEILVDSGRVPLPTKQFELRCADGVDVTVDLAWPDYGALVEVFGVDHLTNEDLQPLDLHRRNQIELAGYRLLIYTGRLLERQPDQFVADVTSLLCDQGWNGIVPARAPGP